jgi:hypothetical protein
MHSHALDALEQIKHAPGKAMLFHNDLFLFSAKVARSDEALFSVDDGDPMPLKKALAEIKKGGARIVCDDVTIFTAEELKRGAK